MTRAASIVAATVAAALAAVTPAAAETAAAVAAARATIVDPQVVRMSWSLTLPTVRGDETGAAFVGNTPTLAMGLFMPRNAQLILRREDTAGLPVTAPAGFQVVSIEGDEALTLRTGADADVSIAREGSIVGGTLPGRAAASIDVASGLILVSAGGPALPSPAAALMVVVQYN